MPEASIVIKSTDRYSDAVKSMAKTTRAFTKDVDSLEEGLYALNKNKYTLKLDVKKAQQALKEAEKQFEKTGDAADGLKMELAQANYDNAVRNLNVVAKAARDTEKEISKLENRRVEKVEDVLNIGDMTWVKVTEIDEKGRVNLSHKDAMKEIAAKEAAGEKIM